MTSGRATWIEIDLESLAHNLRVVRAHLSGARVMAVVKADAYGHGAVEVARRLEREGADGLGVALVEEGIELRQAGVTLPILVLGGFAPPQAEAILGYCSAVRSALTDDGRPPLDACGLKLRDRLSAISASLDRVAEKGGSPPNCRS